MKITLTEINLISDFLKTGSKKAYKADADVYFGYAEKLSDRIIGDGSLYSLEKLGINKYETIFIGARAFSLFYKRKLGKITNPVYKKQQQHLLFLKELLKGKPVFICRLSSENGYYEFTQPEPVSFELAESTSDSFHVRRLRKRLRKTSSDNVKKPDESHMKKIQSYLNQVNLSFLKNCVNLAKRDFDFVKRFNNEMFHQNISYNSKILPRDEVINLYETERFTKIIDLSDIRERIAFISLYGIAVKGMDLNDFYSIDGIFSVQPNREKDSLKQLSGAEVFNLIMNENRQAVTDAVYLMGEALSELMLPELKLNDYNMLRRNYSLYCGIADIGKVFLRIILPDNEKKLEHYQKTAARMTAYSLTEKYFDSVMKEYGDFESENNHIYDVLTRFEAAVKAKKTTAELDFGSKEFKI